MITSKLFNSLFPVAGLNPRKFNLVRQRDELIEALNRILPKYQINSYLRICAFLGNCGIETDYFKTTIEYATGDDYEGRLGLGNTRRGDGRRFKGRGLTQTTGRDNYEDVQSGIGEKLGIDVIKNPEKLAEIEIAVESACIFWKENNLNKYADRGEFKSLSAIVNRGDKSKTPLHWAKRNELYSLCKRRVPKDFSFSITLPELCETQQNQSVGAVSGVSADSQLHNPLPSETVVLTSTEPAKDDSFLAAALDRNVSSDQIKATLPTVGTRIWRYVARPLGLLYAALEAGNIAAWLGIVVLVGILVYLIYAHRADIKKLWDTLKLKFLQ